MKQIKNYLFLSLVMVMFAGVSAYSQDIKDDEGNVIENTSGEPVIQTNGDDKPVYRQDDGKKVVDESEGLEVKTEVKEEIDEELKKKEEEEGTFHETKTETPEEDPGTIKTKIKEKKDKVKEYEDEKGKSESRGNKDKNNDSPYDDD
ncbi:MAG: hypothetical protein KC684_10750, partial [Candidatus Omnitrophica bacterium]|nr:hypothetical protein [Candidatus Omnitrophota bacterium]